jgi:hypothetical protein
VAERDGSAAEAALSGKKLHQTDSAAAVCWFGGLLLLILPSVASQAICLIPKL